MNTPKDLTGGCCPPPPCSAVIARITQYLTTGGAFNPELADHVAVRDLLIDCRDVLVAIQKRDGKHSSPTLPICDSKPNAKELVGVDVPRLVRLVDVIRIVSEHPEYPDPCPMLHEFAAKAAAEMDKEWVMHMVRETCRQTKEAILADLKQSLPNAGGMARELAAQDSESPTNING